MAEGILKARLHDLGRNGISVSSMGIHAPEGCRASPNAVAVCAEHTIDLAGHRSRQLAYDELKTADFIFVMEHFQREYLSTFVPRASDRTFLLAAWPGTENGRRSIPDPVGGTADEYRKIFGLIAGHIERILPFILAELS